jgi:hypothetical protein
VLKPSDKARGGGRPRSLAFHDPPAQSI